MTENQFIQLGEISRYIWMYGKKCTLLVIVADIMNKGVVVGGGLRLRGNSFSSR